MNWTYIIASILWGVAAVSLAAWFLLRAARPAPIVNERRSFPRPKLNFRASLKILKPDGTQLTAQVRGSDLTRLGASVISRHFIGPGSVVFVDLPAYHLMGAGHVLHCRQHGLKYSVGMEFRSPLIRSYEGTWALSVVKHPPAESVFQ
jgi:hypothetical protein